MKYALLVGDGMADRPVAELGGKTPLQAAETPNMDFIARNGRLGRIHTIPAGMTAASDVANMSILGYDPRTYYSGRGPLEAVNLGVRLKEGDVAFRCNLITVSDGILTDYSAGHISSKEAATLISFINEKLGNETFSFFPGVSYRHLLLASGPKAAGLERLECVAPHDMLGKPVAENLPKGAGSETIIRLMEDSRRLLEGHDINAVRIDLKENPANMIWLWGQGKKPAMPTFKERFGLTGSMISAVDLLKGMGALLGLDVINVPGATGYYDTNYEGKAQAALRALEHKDFVFVHVEAPDEAGHNGDLREKITAIERFDKFVVGAVLEELKKKNNGRVLVLPDHATPIELRTHASEPVCFGMFGKDIPGRGFMGYSESEAEKSDLVFEDGSKLMEFFIRAS